MFDRRRILKTAPLLALLGAWPWRTAFAATATERRFVVIILRGGLDGLMAVAPYGDPDYAKTRKNFALGKPNDKNGGLDLDGMFALHPALNTMHETYQAGELLVVHATASPYRERSHFDAQNVLEIGGVEAYQYADGWLNRALAAMPAAGSGPSGIAVGQNVPLILRGKAEITSWAPSVLPDPDADLVARLQDMYQSDPLLGPALAQATAADALVASDMSEDLRPTMGGGGPRGIDRLFGVIVEAAGKFLIEDDGPRVATIELGGWDTHANEGVVEGQLATRLSYLDRGLKQLKTDLAPVWSKTAILVVTEFGRMVAKNGTGGTDHGTGGVAFLAGGAVNGGRVLTDWPGLASRDLFEGRDLKATTDLRAVMKGLVRDHLEVTAAAVEDKVFPDSGAVAAARDLLRA